MENIPNVIKFTINKPLLTFCQCLWRMWPWFPAAKECPTLLLFPTKVRHQMSDRWTSLCPASNPPCWSRPSHRRRCLANRIGHWLEQRLTAKYGHLFGELLAHTLKYLPSPRDQDPRAKNMSRIPWNTRQCLLQYVIEPLFYLTNWQHRQLVWRKHRNHSPKL